MKSETLDHLRDEINRHCAELGSRGLLDTLTITQSDEWAATISIACENGERFSVELDLLAIAIEGGLLDIAAVLH